MNRAGFVLRNAGRSSFRSWVAALAAALLAGMCVVGFVISYGSEASLRTARERFGADLLVIPAGAAQRVETALLMGEPASTFMPEDVVDRIANLPGVLKVSPQLFLSSLSNASCCSVGEMFLVAYDPETDFTLKPWLEREVPGGLKFGEAIGGKYVASSGGRQVKVYGTALVLRANLAATGTGIDRTLFFTFETARAVARESARLAEAPLKIPEKSISALLVRIAPHHTAANVAVTIEQERGIKAISSPMLFQSYRTQMGLIRGALWVFGLVSVGGAALIIGLVFTLASNERRREIGVLRALGATRAFVLGAFLGEAALLAVFGAFLGVALSGLVIFLFHELFVVLLGVPFVLPSAAVLAAQGATTIVFAVGIAILAAAWPAWRRCHEEPAQAMRERA